MIRKKPLAIFLLAWSGGAAAVYWHWSHHPVPFDAAAWRAAEKSVAPDSPRLRMADGLVGSGTLLGKTPAQVQAMLGEPTDVGTFRNYDLVYLLGMERRYFTLDPEWLALKLGKDGRVEDAQVVAGLPEL